MRDALAAAITAPAIVARATVGAAALVAMLAAPVAAAPRKADREALAAARPAGKPLSCVPIVGIRETRVRSDDVIDFYMRGGQVYRNTLPQSCPQLGFEEAFSYATSLSELCSVDIITVINRSGPGVRGPSCGLGEFQPVTGVKR